MLNVSNDFFNAVRLGLGIIAAATLCSFAILCLRLSADPNRYSPLWPKYVQERIHSTCAYIGGTIFIASRIAVAAFRSPAVMKFMICMVSIFGTYINTAEVDKVVRSAIHLVLLRTKFEYSSLTRCVLLTAFLDRGFKLRYRVEMSACTGRSEVPAGTGQPKRLNLVGCAGQARRAH